VSFDLYSDESANRISSLRPVLRPEPGAWDNFLSGTARYTMRGFAETGRAVDLLGSVGPIIQDRIAGGTEAQDRYFREHEEVFTSAVDHWTPKPGEVGAAGQIAGQLLSTLPLVIASPGAAVASLQLSAGEELVRKGVSAGKAQAVGAAQAAGLGLGIWVPILGANLWQRAVVGGAGFNVAQGAVTRGVSGTILEGTPAAEDFKAFDWSAVTLDALLGLAFGGLAHLSPAQRKQGENAWKRIHEWVSGAKPSDIDALAALRQAEHLNVDSAPGRPEGLADIEAHTAAMRKAVDDLVHGRPVDVEGMLEGARFLPDAERSKLQQGMADELAKQARALLHSDMELQAAKKAAEETPGFLRTAEQQLALREPNDVAAAHPDITRAIEIARKPGFQRTATEKLFLDSMLTGRAADYLLEGVQRPVVEPAKIEEPPAAGELGKPTVQADPLARAAETFMSENPDMQIKVGVDAEGQPITKPLRQYVDEAKATAELARSDSKSIFEAAAQCLLGGGR